MKKLLTCLLVLSIVLSNSCQKEGEDSSENELWIYTSLYKDTIADLTEKLKVDFPGVKFNWYQAGSEDIASKVNAEILAGSIKADVLISSDRFWYEELTNQDFLHSYKHEKWESIPSQLKHKKATYSAVSIPVMVLAYNKDALSTPPKGFKELSSPSWKDKFTTGSPLSSGTNFTTMAMLQSHYGWDFFKALKRNNTIAQGGNSAVIRRLQNKERVVGWVLLENLLRLTNDKRIQTIFPSDGAVTHANVLALTKKSSSRDLATKFANWMFSQKGQSAMTRSFMYSPVKGFPAPKGAPAFDKLIENSFDWTPKFIEETTKNRSKIKEEYTKIMFQ